MNERRNHRDEPTRVGAVVIGRNEGDRLRRCLESVRKQVDEAVYVDSGSTDGSAEAAERLGVEVHRLTEGPFTAARGRQVGFEALLRRAPEIEYVQFVDGDCVLEDGWIRAAALMLAEDPSLAAATGRRSEERREESVWSRIVDADWRVPPGETDALGGDSLIRAEALRRVGGWRTDLIAGEDPELSFRFVDAGWRIYRLDRGMSRHDIAMSRFREYWRRHVRAGHAYAEVARMHWRGAGARWARRVAGILLYGAALPAALLIGVVFFRPLALAAILVYMTLILRMTLHRRREGEGLFTALAYAALTAVCKVANAIGVMGYFTRAVFGRRRGLIEYRADRGAPTQPAAEHHA